MGDWNHETSLSWWDETFVFSDLYREQFRALRVDGKLLALIRDAADERERDVRLCNVGINNKLHRERVAQELVTHAAPPQGAAASSSTSAAPSGGGMGAGTCVVCFDEPAEWACLPCGHLCMCETCCNDLIKAHPRADANGRALGPPRCPICRRDVANPARIFLAAPDQGNQHESGAKRPRTSG